MDPGSGAVIVVWCLWRCAAANKTISSVLRVFASSWLRRSLTSVPCSVRRMSRRIGSTNTRAASHSRRTHCNTPLTAKTRSHEDRTKKKSFLYKTISCVLRVFASSWLRRISYQCAVLGPPHAAAHRVDKQSRGGSLPANTLLHSINREDTKTTKTARRRNRFCTNNFVRPSCFRVFVVTADLLPVCRARSAARCGASGRQTLARRVTPGRTRCITPLTAKTRRPQRRHEEKSRSGKKNNFVRPSCFRVFVVRAELLPACSAASGSTNTPHKVSVRMAVTPENTPADSINHEDTKTTKTARRRNRFVQKQFRASSRFRVFVVTADLLPFCSAASESTDTTNRLSVSPLQRLQELDQVGLLRGGEIQPEQAVVVIHDRQEIGRAAVMKVRRMLPQPAQRRRPVLAGGGSGGIAADPCRPPPDRAGTAPCDRDRSGRR